MEFNLGGGGGARSSGNDVELLSKTLQVEHKLFYFDLKENPHGRYLKISEKMSATRSTIIVPFNGISWFFDIFNYYVTFDDQDISRFFLQVFYFDIGENRRGRLLIFTRGIFVRKDPILMPSQDSRLSVGTIRREVGSKVVAVEQIQETPLVIKSTSLSFREWGRMWFQIIAPVIHEWTYDAMFHDLLQMEGNKYVHVVPSKTGDGYERKEVLLEDPDPASERLHDKMTNFVSRNKAAQMHGRDGGEMSTRDLQKMVQALPQYNEQMDKLSLHVDLAGKINGIIREMGLRDVGQLEQDLVFGDAGTKDIIKFLKEQDATDEQKIRLLMIYVATHLEKFETDKLAKILDLADLLPEDMKAIYNMRFLESAPDSMNNSNSGFPLKFDKKRRGLRKDRPGEEVA
ncbi:hypothetical protein Lser_V15G28788 [Lactuca serriola]